MENVYFKNDQFLCRIRLGIEPPQKAFISAFIAHVPAVLISTDLQYLSEHCFQALNFSSLSVFSLMLCFRSTADIQGDDLM